MNLWTGLIGRVPAPDPRYARAPGGVQIGLRRDLSNPLAGRCRSLRQKKSGAPERAPEFFVAEWTGLEPATPGVTGRYSNQLNYHSEPWWVLTGSNRRPSPCKGDALPAELSTPKNGLNARPSGSSGALVYGILQAFASLETRNITCLDMDRFASSWVASHACRTSLNRERSEADQRHRTALRQGALNGIERCVYCFCCISP